MNSPKIIDNDRDEITAVLDGIEIRGWSYANSVERGWKMRMAREFVEGWYQQEKRPVSAAPEDSPLMLAWKEYRASEDFRNTLRWYGKPEQLPEGTLWAAFMAGFYAGGREAENG